MDNESRDFDFGIRGDNSYSIVPWWFRLNTNFPRSQQEIQCAILPELGSDRRRESAVLQAAGNHYL